MTTITLENILDTANEAYQCRELRINEPLEQGERGDGLADFLANELRESCEGMRGEALCDTAIHAVTTAINQLEEVRLALWAL